VIVKMIVEKQMECRLAGETEVLEENLPQRHFCPSQNPTWPDPGLNQGRRGEKPATNRLSYDAASLSRYLFVAVLRVLLNHIKPVLLIFCCQNIHVASANLSPFYSITQVSVSNWFYSSIYKG
jgi:hypothetical protein